MSIPDYEFDTPALVDLDHVWANLTSKARFVWLVWSRRGGLRRGPAGLGNIYSSGVIAKYPSTYFSVNVSFKFLQGVKGVTLQISSKVGNSTHLLGCARTLSCGTMQNVDSKNLYGEGWQSCSSSSNYYWPARLTPQISKVPIWCKLMGDQCIILFTRFKYVIKKTGIDKWISLTQ